MRLRNDFMLCVADAGIQSLATFLDLLLRGSGGLSKYVNNGDNQGYYMGYRDHQPTY